jgi:hypothetical protein
MQSMRTTNEKPHKVYLWGLSFSKILYVVGAKGLEPLTFSV